MHRDVPAADRTPVLLIITRAPSVPRRTEEGDVEAFAAVRLGTRPGPHAYAYTYLSNTASLPLPVSNLTNLRAFKAGGPSFTRFAVLMALPWLVAVIAEHVGHRRR